MWGEQGGETVKLRLKLRLSFYFEGCHHGASSSFYCSGVKVSFVQEPPVSSLHINIHILVTDVGIHCSGPVTRCCFILDRLQAALFSISRSKDCQSTLVLKEVTCLSIHFANFQHPGVNVWTEGLTASCCCLHRDQWNVDLLFYQLFIQ